MKARNEGQFLAELEKLLNPSNLGLKRMPFFSYGRPFAEAERARYWLVHYGISAPRFVKSLSRTG